MFPKSSLMGFIILGLSSHSIATDGGHSGPGDLPVCPASCIQTVTVTSTASYSYFPSTLQTSIPSYIHTHTNGGGCVNATASESSVIPYTTIIIMPAGVNTGSASIAEHISSTHSYHNYNSTLTNPGATSSLNTSSSTLISNYTYTHTSSISPSLTSEVGGMPTDLVRPTFTTLPSPGVPSIPTVTLNGCHHDNCLRQFIRHTQVTDFCATYTTAMNTATTDLPDYVSQCHTDPTRISSACSCAVTPIIPSELVSTKPPTTKTAGGVFTSLPHNTVTYDPASFTTAEGCTLSSVVFETHTTTTTFSVTVSVGADISMSTDASNVKIVTSSLAILSFTSIPYFNSSMEVMTSIATSTRG